MPHDYAIKEIINRSTSFEDITDFAPLIEKFKDKKVVMLGESTHGTKEFYEWRSRISRELMENHGFNFIAVEGDWPPCQEINSYINNETSLDAHEVLTKFSRWPTWMWNNGSILETMEWMREFNTTGNASVGFHGLDVYSLYESIDEVIKHISDVNPNLASKIKDFYGCFEPYRKNEMDYVKSLLRRPTGCEKGVTQALEAIIKKRLEDKKSFFDVSQNVRIIQNAEKYYRSMVFSESDDSWNVRDQHMMDTLDMLLEHHGPEAKGIVWAHNSHIGDYRATDMVVHQMVNLGGLARIKYGKKNVALLGFATDHGTVTASSAWDGSVQVMDLPEARRGSLEALLKKAVPEVGSSDFYVTFDNVEEHSTLLDYKGHRAVGVVYASHESQENYVPTAVANRYDALVFIERTSAVVPLGFNFNRHQIPETYPFGARF